MYTRVCVSVCLCVLMHVLFVHMFGCVTLSVCACPGIAYHSRQNHGILTGLSQRSPLPSSPSRVSHRPCSFPISYLSPYNSALTGCHFLNLILLIHEASQVVLVVKNPPANAGASGDVGSIPGLGRSLGGGNGNPLQYSCLENLMERGAW